jgi:CheY-like chemotaxis protein
MMRDGGTIAITILICDDDEEDRLLTRQALEQAGILNPLKFVESGAQLLDYLHQRGEFAGNRGEAPRPGLILLDLHMPKMGGLEALARIRAADTLRAIPVVMLSTTGANEDILRSYELGVNSFIAKPVTFSELVEAIKVIGRYWFKIVELPPVPG